MNLQGILTAVIASVLSSALVTSAIVYVLKRAFDKTLDLKFAELLEHWKQQTTEQYRRKRELFDQQADVYQKLLSSVYRIRNLSKDLTDANSPEKTNDILKEYIGNSTALQDLLYEKRAILPNSVFYVAHEVKSVSRKLEYEFSELWRRERGNTTNSFQEFRERILEITHRLDEAYGVLVDIIQPKLGVSQEE